MGANGDDSYERESVGETARLYNGQIRRTVDEKNRLSIPSRWRDARYQEFHALPDRKNPCLKLLNSDELRRMQRTIDESPDYSPAEKKQFRRFYFSRATPCPVDKQGRMVIPPELQERYRFAGEIVVVGACECLELWHLEDWENAEAGSQNHVDAMAESLGF
jgi:MraZ protein